MTFTEALRRFVEARNSFEGAKPPPDAAVNMTFEGRDRASLSAPASPSVMRRFVSIIDVKTWERLNPARDIRIGDDVRIHKGVEVGAGCIVAARSRLTRSLPPRTLSAGTPARVIREDVAWVRERL